jgi:hypothetical protein
MKSWRATLASTAAFAAAWGIAASGPQWNSDGITLALSNSERRSDGNLHFDVAGRSVGGLYPGATRQLVVQASNPFGYPLLLRGVYGRVTWSSRRGCPANDSSLRVSTDGRTLPVKIAPHSRATLRDTLTVTMPKDTTPRCSKTSFVIHLDAVAARADR